MGGRTTRATFRGGAQLLAQALTEGVTFVTGDAQLGKYRGPVSKV